MGIFKKLEGILTEKLMSIKRMSELKLKITKELVPLATLLKQIKDKYNFKCDKEMMKEIRKHCQY